MKAKKIYLTLALVAAFSFIAIAAFSHGYDSRYGYGHMMGPGYGYGHMGYRDGYGHMGRGYGYMHDGTYNNVDDLQAWLNLSDKQVKQIIKLDSEYNEKFYESRGDRNKIYELREQYNNDFEKLLTNSQKKKFNEARNNRNSYFCRW